MAWHAALFATIFFLEKLSCKKKGAIKGPVAPINTVLSPLIIPTL